MVATSNQSVPEMAIDSARVFMHGAMRRCDAMCVKCGHKRRPMKACVCAYNFILEYYHIYINNLVDGLEHGFYFSIYWECHHPN